MSISTVSNEKAPGHWLLARLGKKILRPGGRELTTRLLNKLGLTNQDHVVEFAPGVGATARALLAYQPASYTAVERDEEAAAITRKVVTPSGGKVVLSTAQQSALPEGSATVVVGEAMLTMQSDVNKNAVMSEAHRLLQTGGRYVIHELCLIPDDISEERSQAVWDDLSRSIHVGARPLTAASWRAILENNGFRVIAEERADMALLAPRRLIDDEGLWPAMRFFARVATDRSARSRVKSMHACFNRLHNNMGAIGLIVEKV